MDHKDIEANFPLIDTKLHRPPLPVDMVLRPRLTKWLQLGQERPLALVSAPAGYGKSTLISCWLESANCPFSWVSLDEHDNELSVFLSYFLAAIQKIFPAAMPESQALLFVTSITPVATIARVLINEIDQIQQSFILVLDDYHRINSQAIHDLLSELLLHPPSNLHLVLGTRMDPPLPLVILRASAQVTEIRVPDLRFHPRETLLLFQKMIDTSIDPADVEEAEAESEGWVTGLRLAALAMRHRIGRGAVQGKLSLNNSYVVEYLLTEILNKQAAMLSDCILKVSILERICSQLCTVVCFPEARVEGDGAKSPEFTGEQFFQWLQASNLFVIPLDDKHEWFRFHHLFRDFLRQELARRMGKDEIAKLHAAAAGWYARNGWIDEALVHLLAAGDQQGAIKLIADHRYSLLNATQWTQLERWLELFPASIIETSAELVMLKAWLAYHRSQYAELDSLLRHLIDLTSSESAQYTSSALEAEINTLLSLITYHSGDYETSLTQAQKALENLPGELWSVRILARLFLSGNLLARGDASGAIQAMYGAFEEEKVQSDHFKATLLMAVCHLHWIAADLKSQAQAARQSMALSRKTGRQQIYDYASYHLGAVLYQHNELAAAEDLFSSSASRPYLNYGTSYVGSICGLALTYQAQGNTAKAQEVSDGGVAFLLKSGNISKLPLLLALQAKLALLQGNLPAASQWAEEFGRIPPFASMLGLLSVHLTLVEVWLAQNTPDSLEKASNLLEQLLEYLESYHNTRFFIEALALQASLMLTLGDQPAARSALEHALKLAQPGGFIRLFVDLGDQVKELLVQLRNDNALGAYCTQILSAHAGSHLHPDFTHMQVLDEPLTHREYQILELLQERLTNKEIANKLVISPGTVRTHAVHIYEKLEVNGRRQAVEKAIAMGILVVK